MGDPPRNQKRQTNRGRRPRRGRTSKTRVKRNRRSVRRSLTGKKTGKRKKKAGRWKSRLGALGLIFVGLLSGVVLTAAVGFLWFRDRRGPVGAGPVAVSWPDGLGPGDAAELLADLGLTDNAGAMTIFLRATDSVDCAVAGPHLLPSGATPRELVAALCRHPNRPEVKVTIPEGFHRFAIAKRFAQKGIVSEEAFLHASADPEALYRLGVQPSTHPRADTAEGFLFPATYPFPIDSDPATVVARLVTETQRRFDRLTKRHPEGWNRLQNELGLDRRGALTLASMVEKEAAVADERVTIASVFLNRMLRDDYPHLQSDPTAMYGCYAMADAIPACRDFEGRATGAINRDRANVFSTYVTPGLPPGPVCNPGDASIEAVLKPADTTYLFFVAKGGGRHTFSEDYDAHQQAVERLRAMRQ
jgi:peptidoglycan lytic transglycosylase G